MSDATQPQNDRELLLSLNGKLSTLADSIDRFSLVLKDLEEKKIANLEKKITELQDWRQQINGGWKLAVVIWVILTAGVVGTIKLISK